MGETKKKRRRKKASRSSNSPRVDKPELDAAAPTAEPRQPEEAGAERDVPQSGEGERLRRERDHFQGQARLQLQIIKEQKAAIERLAAEADARDQELVSRGNEVRDLAARLEQARQREVAAAAGGALPGSAFGGDEPPAGQAGALAEAEERHRAETDALKARLAEAEARAAKAEQDASGQAGGGGDAQQREEPVSDAERALLRFKAAQEAEQRQAGAPAPGDGGAAAGVDAADAAEPELGGAAKLVLVEEGSGANAPSEEARAKLLRRLQHELRAVRACQRQLRTDADTLQAATNRIDAMREAAREATEAEKAKRADLAARLNHVTRFIRKM